MARRPTLVPERILLLAMLPIGDTLLVEPTVRALRVRYPRALLTALTRSGTAPLWRCWSMVDDVIELAHGPRALTGMLRDVRRRHYDAAIHFTSPAYKWISLLGGIPRRTYMKFDRLWWLDPRPHPRWRAIHAARHYYDCAREFDLPAWERLDHIPRLELPDPVYAEAEAFLRRARGVPHAAPLVGIHPGGAGMRGLKRWRARAFAALADELHDDLGADVLLLGSPEERNLADRIRAAARHEPLDAVGRVPLLVSLALIAGCDVLVGNDSAPLHAAAALGTAYVGIFGPTSPANFRPLPVHHGQGRLVQPDPPCFEPRSFVGGQPIWDRPRCRSRCAALVSLPVEHVLATTLAVWHSRARLRFA